MQNTKQVLDGDNKDIFKRKREFYLDEDLVDKIDSIEYGAQVNKIEEIEVNGVPVEPDESKTVKLKIPRVINAVTSDSESDALSAAMGKYLYTLISEGGGGGGGGEYTAGKGISIIGNVISNTLPGAVVSAAAPANPSKGTSWYDTTNDILKVYNGSSWVEVGNGKQAYFKTQDEYDALPASKESDGNLYIIVDTHINLIPYAELIQLTPTPDAILDELNKHPKDYAEYYYNNGDIQMQGYPSSVLPRADAYMKTYIFSIDNGTYIWVDTNLTEQELANISSNQEQVEGVLSGERFYDDHR